MAAMTAPRCTSVLIVEDLADVAETTAELLSLCGFQAAVAPNGAAAIQMAVADRPDVLLLDLWLPDIHGVEVARRVRLQTGKQPKIVALTGQSSVAERNAAKEAGVDVFLVKPVSPEMLLEALAVHPASSAEPGHAA